MAILIWKKGMKELDNGDVTFISNQIHGWITKKTNNIFNFFLIDTLELTNTTNK